MVNSWTHLVFLYIVCLSLLVPLRGSNNETEDASPDPNDTDSPWFVGEEERDCPDMLSPRFIPEIFFSSSKIPLGTPYRSHLTAPEAWVTLAPSRIPGAGLGAFARTFIPAFTWLAEYEGETVTVEESDEHDMDPSYMWQLTKDGNLLFYVDAINGRTSNWLRFGNCARHISEQNMEPMFCYGKVYYITSRDISPGTELLTYYGDGYAEELGINVTAYYDLNAQLNFTKSLDIL